MFEFLVQVSRFGILQGRISPARKLAEVDTGHAAPRDGRGSCLAAPRQAPQDRSRFSEVGAWVFSGCCKPPWPPCLLTLLWQPAIMVAELKPQQNIIAVLVDDSRSMAITENGSTRQAQAVKALQGGVLTEFAEAIPDAALSHG